MKSTLLALGISGVCLVGATFLSAPLKKRGENKCQPAPSPGPTALAVSSIEHDLALADVAWLDVVQRIGSAKVRDELHFRCVGTLAEIATDLDGRYFSVYDAASIYLSAYGSQADLSDQLLTKGLSFLPQVWKLHFTLGWNDYFIRGQALEASQHWRAAAILPGAPIYLGSLSGRALRQATGDIQQSIEFLEAMRQHIRDPQQLKLINERMAILRSEYILNEYDHACEQFTKSENRPPESAGELFLLGLVSRAPIDELGSPIYLDHKDGRCRARSKLIKVREDEAIKRVGAFRDSPAMN